MKVRRRDDGRGAEANCDDCAWTHEQTGGQREVDAVNAAARKHVRSTGHTVTMGVAQWFTFAEDDRPPGTNPLARSPRPYPENHGRKGAAMGSAQDFRDDIRRECNRYEFDALNIFARCVDCGGPLFSPRCSSCDPAPRLSEGGE